MNLTRMLLPRAWLKARAADPAYVYQPAPARATFDEAVRVLERQGHRIVQGPVPASLPNVVDKVVAGLRESGIAVRDYVVDLAAYNRYFEEAGYLKRYPNYYADNRTEKSLEHFVALDHLKLTRDDVFIDLASERSPAPEIFGRLSGARCYAQDIQYEPGVHGSKIGGDACAMPVQDRFATAASLTCSLEHFEGDSDSRLFREMVRVLRAGGRLCVAPLYMFEVAATQTDPLYSAKVSIPFDRDTILYCAPGWRNRHGRFYTPRTLQDRIISKFVGDYDFVVHRIANVAELPEDVYLRLFMTCERRARA